MEEVLIQKAVETTRQILHDKGLFVSFPDADEALKDFLFVTRRRGHLEQSKGCRSMILFIKINWKIE